MIRIVAAWAENFHGEFSGDVGQTYGQDRLALAEGPWAPSEIYILELLQLE